MFTKHSLHLAVIALGYAFGIMIVFYTSNSFILASVPVAILLILLIYYTRKEPNVFWVFCFLLSLVLGGLRADMLPSMQERYLKESSEKQLFQLSITKKLKNSLKQERYEGVAKKVSPSEPKGTLWMARQTAEKILLVRPKDSGTIAWALGDKIWAQGYLSGPGAPKVPGQFNYAAYLRSQGIYCQLYITQSSPANRLAPFHSSWKQGLYSIQYFKETLLSKIAASALSENSFQVYSALIFGDKSSFNSELMSDYQNAGAVHILAISGLHIGILIALLYWMLLPLHRLKKGRQLSGLLILICLWSYAAFTGFSHSVVRAMSMYSFLSLSLLIKRPQYSLHLLVVAFFTNLIWDPLAIFSLGFAMSYAAVATILLGMPILNKLWSPKNKILKSFWQLIGVSLCAQIGVIGLSLFSFHQFPFLFLLTNLMVIPFLGLILAAGIFLALWFVLGTPPLMAVTIFDLLLYQLNEVVGWLGGQDAWVLKHIYFPRSYLWGTTALTMGFLAWKYPYYKKPNPWKYFLFGLAIFQCCMLFQAFYDSQKRGHFLIKNREQTALIAINSDTLYYWSSKTLDPKSVETLRSQYPFETLYKKAAQTAYTFKGESIVTSPKGPRKIKQINYLVIDEKTTAYPQAFTEHQLHTTKLIFSSYSQTKQMYVWENWAKKNERPIWKLDAQGFYTFK